MEMEPSHWVWTELEAIGGTQTYVEKIAPMVDVNGMFNLNTMPFSTISFDTATRKGLVMRTKTTLKM
jgi:hypothetical protein